MRFSSSGFFMIQFPPSPRVSYMRAVSNFFEYSRRYSQIKACSCSTGVIDTGGKFRCVFFQGLGGKMIHEKT
jgi:hypothetical protein